jgi:hypothetical protein
LKLRRLPKIEDSMKKWSASSFGPPIWVRRGGLWAKHMGLKGGAIGNTFGEHIGNPGNILKTHWELEGNMLGTKEKGKKILPPTQNFFKKKVFSYDNLEICTLKIYFIFRIHY